MAKRFYAVCSIDIVDEDGVPVHTIEDQVYPMELVDSSYNHVTMQQINRYELRYLFMNTERLYDSCSSRDETVIIDPLGLTTHIPNPNFNENRRAIDEIEEQLINHRLEQSGSCCSATVDSSNDELPPVVREQMRLFREYDRETTCRFTERYADFIEGFSSEQRAWLREHVLFFDPEEDQSALCDEFNSRFGCNKTQTEIYRCVLYNRFGDVGFLDYSFSDAQVDWLRVHTPFAISVENLLNDFNSAFGCDVSSYQLRKCVAEHHFSPVYFEISDPIIPGRNPGHAC